MAMEINWDYGRNICNLAYVFQDGRKKRFAMTPGVFRTVTRSNLIWYIKLSEIMELFQGFSITDFAEIYKDLNPEIVEYENIPEADESPCACWTHYMDGRRSHRNIVGMIEQFIHAIRDEWDSPARRKKIGWQ